MTDVAQEAGQDYPPDQADVVATSEEMMPAAPANHPASSRRQRIQALTFAFSHISVPKGTQQAEAILTVRDRARVLALTIEERCPEGPEKAEALHKVHEALMWADHAIRHR